MLWYGLQKYLSWIPLLLLLTILGYLLWNGSVEKVASLVVSYVFIWTVLLGLVEHFWTNAEFCAQVGRLCFMDPEFENNDGLDSLSYGETQLLYLLLLSAADLETLAAAEPLVK